MTLLQDRARAKQNLIHAENYLNDAYKLNNFGRKRTLKYIRICKKVVRLAKEKLAIINHKLSKIENHAESPEMELMTKLMIIFEPETKEKIEKIEKVKKLVTFT